MSLKVKPVVMDSRTASLIDVLPDSTGRCWLIPETEESLFPVFDAKPDDIARIIENCPFYEYYVLSKNYDWLVIESDHNQFFICRATP